MKAINIILDESLILSSGFSGFVEIEDDNGRSIHIGERIPYGGLARLRITTADIDLAVPDLTAKTEKDAV